MPKRRKFKVVRASDGTESALERKFLRGWNHYYPNHPPITQLKFSKYNWRFDFAWPTKIVAVEIQGMGVSHCSLPGMTSDYDKLMQALILGWRVVYFTRTHLSPERIEGSCHNLAKLLGVYTSPTEEVRRYIRRRNI